MESQDIVARLLPVGTAAERAVRVLDSLGVEHSSFERSDPIITANFGESYREGMITGHVYVTLHFDKQDRLLQAEVKQILTGP